MLDLSGLNLEKEDKNKIDLSGLELEKEDKNEIDLSGLGLEKDKKSVTDILEAAGSKLYDGVNKIIKPATDVAKNINIVTDTIKNTVSPTNVIKNIANNSTVKEYNNTEPILRARTAEDDKAKTIYEPDSFDILGNKIAVASAGGSVKNIEELKKLKDKQDFAVLSAQLPILALTGAMPITALAGFAGLQQLKNLIVTKAKGEKYSPMQIRMLAETLPEDTNEYVKLGASLLEAVGDTAVVGAGVNKFKKTLLSDAANNTIDKLKKAGYKVSPEQEKQFKTAVAQRADSINPDDAVAINIKTKMAKVPKNKINVESNINENNFIETAGDIADRYKNHSNIQITQEQKNKDFNNLILIENIVKSTKPNIKMTGKELLPKDNIETAYDLNNVDTVRNLAKKYYKDNLQKKGYYLTRPEIDGKIYFTGRQKFFSANNNNIEALKMLPVIKEIIEKGKVLPFSKAEPRVLKKANKNIIGYYFISDVIEQNGINKLVTISLEKDKFGNFFYNLNNGIIDTLKKKLGDRFVPDLESGVQSPSTNIIGQNGDGVNNLENDSIVADDSNIDTSFNPAEWDENYAKQLEDEARAKEEYEKQFIEELKENGAVPTIKSEKERLKNMGIGKILRPKKNEQMYAEYKHLSPRMQREFFYDEKDGIVNNSSGYTWDNAEHDLQKAMGNDTASIWEELESIDRNVSRYEDLGFAVDGKSNNKKVTSQDNIDNIVVANNKPVDIIQVTSLPNLKNPKNGNLELHTKAKAGDFDSAYELIDNLLTVKRKDGKTNLKANMLINQFKKMAQEHPNAVVLPIGAQEASGHNMLPYAYADKIAQITGLKIDYNIYQINKTHHTGAGKTERLFDRAIFDGKVVPGLEYIIVDDVLTTGSNINELRKYIERRDGKVVGVSILGTGNQGRAFTLLEETKEKLYNKFGKEDINEYLKRNNIANSAEELTELQARIILKQSKQSIKSGRAETVSSREGASKTENKSSRSEVLRGRINPEESNNNPNLSLGGKDRAAYSAALKTDVKIRNNETPKEKDFKLYQRTYDLAKKYMVNNIAESKYRPRNTLGVYYNYGSRKGNIYLNSLLNVDVVAHELVHAIDDQQQIITDLYDKGFTANTIYKGKRAFTTFVPDVNTFEGKAAAEILKACKDLYPVDISKQSVKNRLAEGLATIIQHSIINPDMIESLYPNAYKWAMGNDTLQSFRNDARQIVVDYESLNPVEQLTTEIYDKAQKVKDKTKIPIGVRIDSQFFDSEAVLKMLDKDLYLTAKGYRTVLKGVLENNLTNKDGKMYIIDNHGNPVKVSDTVNWRTLIEDVQKAQSEFNGYLVARRFVAWYDMRDKLANGLVISGNNLKKLQKRYDEVSKKIKEQDFYNIHDQKATFQLEQDLKREIDKLTKKIEQDGAKLQELQSILAKSGKNEEKIKEAYKFLDNTQNRELAKKYDFLMKCNLTVLRTAKLIDKDMYNELVANYGYAPFNRVAYNELTGDGKEFVEKIGAKNDVVPKIVSSNWNIKNLKKIEGSDLPILSPLYSSIQLMKEAYKKSYKQLIANRMGEIADLYPDLMQKVPYIKGDEKNNKLVVVGTDKRTGKEIKQTLEMDPFVKTVWNSLVENYQMSLWEKAMVAPAKFFTLMTTADNPIFAITNFARDQVTASVNSDMGYKPFFTPIMTYVKCRQNPELKQYYDEYNELFGESNTFLSNLDEVNPDDLAEAFKTNALWKVFGFGKKALSFLPNLSEVVTRRTEYVKARGAGFDIITAKRLADEVSVPFGDRGLWGGAIGRSLLRSVPYMNAGLQVIRQGVRSLLTTNGNELLKNNNVGRYENLGLVGGKKNNVLTDKEIKIATRFIKFLDNVPVEIQPHESLSQKEGENFFGNIKDIEHNELGKTLFVKSTVGKLIGHKGFDTSTIIRLLPELYKNSVLIDSPTEKAYTKTEHKQHNNIAFWHNTLNKFKIGEDNYIIRFTVAERKVGKNKKKGTIGERYLHSNFISGIELKKEKDGNVINTGTIPGRTLPSDDIVADYIKIVNKYLNNKNNSSTDLFLGGKPKDSYSSVYQNYNDKDSVNNGFYKYKEKNKFLKTLFAMVGLGAIQAAVSLWWDYIEDKTRQNLKEQLNPAQFIRFAYLPWGFNDTDLLRLPWEQLYSFPAVIAAMIHDEMKNDYDYKLSEYVEVLTGGVVPDNFNIIVPLIKTLAEKDNSGWEQLMYRDFPQIVKIGLMLGGGKKTYPTLQDIVPKYLQKREKALQYDEKTSDIAKFLGKQFNIAPIKIDYYIYNVAGQVGSMFEKGAEFILDKLSGKTQTELTDFVTGNVTEKEKAFRKTVMPWLQESYFISGREMQQFYDERERFEALEKSYKEGLRKLTSEELNYLRLNSPYIKGISKKITAYNKFVKNSTDSRKNLTFEQQKDNEKAKIKMENEIVDIIRKYKRAVKKAA